MAVAGIGRRLLSLDAACAAVLIVWCLALGLPRYRAGLDPRDEGCLAYGAERVMEGQIPNRDFVSYQPPLSFYTAATMFQVFGTSLRSLRILGLAIYVAMPLLIFGIARMLTGVAPAFAAAVGSIYLGIPSFSFVPYGAWQGLVASTATIWICLAAMRKGRGGGMMFGAGLLTAATFLMRQDQGLYLTLSILAFGAALGLGHLVPPGELKRSALWCGAGMAALAAPCGLVWGIKGAWPSMFQQLVVFPVSGYAKTSAAPFPLFHAAASFGENASVALAYLPPVVVVCGAVWLLARLRRKSLDLAAVEFFLILTWAALYYCQFLTRSDLDHLVITLPPFFILCACLWSAVSEGMKVKLAIGATALLVEAGLLFATNAVFFPNVSGLEEIPLPRAGVRVAHGEGYAALIRRMQDFTPANRSMLCLPYEPIYYFLCERRNPTRWNYLWPGDQTAADHQTLIDEAKQDPPALVAITGEEAMKAYAPEIVAFVQTNFLRAAAIGDLSVFTAK